MARLWRKVLLVVTAMAVLAASMPGAAGAAAKKDSSKDAGANLVVAGPGSAKGKGFADTEGGLKFKFGAKSSKGAAAPLFPAKGKYVFKGLSGQFVQGKVQCLVVDGTGGANLAGPVTKSNVVAVGTPNAFDVFDSGEPKGQGDLLIYRGPSLECSTPSDKGAPVTSGNIVVKPPA